MFYSYSVALHKAADYSDPRKKTCSSNDGFYQENKYAYIGLDNVIND